MRPVSQSAFNFRGIHLRTHPARMKIDVFQKDENGTRYQMRTWRPRQGLSRASVSIQAAPISGMYSFSGEDYGRRFLTVSGSSIDGEANAAPFWDEGLVGIGSSVYTVT